MTETILPAVIQTAKPSLLIERINRVRESSEVFSSRHSLTVARIDATPNRTTAVSIPLVYVDNSPMHISISLKTQRNNRVTLLAPGSVTPSQRAQGQERGSTAHGASTSGALHVSRMGRLRPGTSGRSASPVTVS